jgi:DNA-binding MarR family transcriptional regulator
MAPNPPTTAGPAQTASELRAVLGALVRRLRAENRLPLPQIQALGRLYRDGTQSVSDLAAAEHIRPQSMAQTIGDLESAGLVFRRPDPSDGRRALVELTPAGDDVLLADRAQREGWLARAITDDLSPEEQALLERAVPLLRRLAES